MNLLQINLLIAFIWAAASGDFSVASAATGFVAGFAALAVFSMAQGGKYATRLFVAVDLTLYFIYDLLGSTWDVARAVLRPGRIGRACFIEIPLDVSTDGAIAMMANLITLTPGTLSVDVADDRRTLLIHAMFAEDEQAVIDGIKRGLERRVRRLME